MIVIIRKIKHSSLTKTHKKKTSTRCTSCLWSITIQQYFLIKANKNITAPAIVNECIDLNDKYNDVMQISNDVHIVEWRIHVKNA